MKNKSNDLSSFIYSHELYYTLFVVLNLYINNINVMGARATLRTDIKTKSRTLLLSGCI
jgi:hypothetical protein